MMICKAELKHELEQSLEAGMMTERFAVLAEEIVRGWYSQRSASGWAHAVDDVLGLFRVKLSRHWKKLDPRRNAFAAITQMGRRCGMDWQRKYDARKKREAAV
jgi:hypothetical protein